MKSEKRLFSKTVFINNIKRMWPFWSLAIVCGFFCIMAYCSHVVERANWVDEVTSLYSKADCFEALTELLPISLLFYAAIIGVGVWFYLYTQSGNVFMNSIPIGRDALFITNFISGMVMIVTPYILTLIGFTLASVFFGLFSEGVFMTALFTILVEAFVFFAIATLVAIITGVIPANIILYLFINYLAVIVEMMFSDMASRFLFGIQYSCDYKLSFLSPAFYFINDIRVKRSYIDIEFDRILSGVELENIDKLWLFLLGAIAVTIIAFALNRKRRSEATTEVVAFETVKSFLIFIFALLGTIGGAGYIYAILHSFTEKTYIIFEVIIYAFIAGFICFFVAQMIANKSAKVFNKINFVKYGSLMLLSIVILCLFSIDPMDRTKYRPDNSEILRVDISVADKNLLLYPDEDELINKFENMRMLVIEEGDRRKGEGDKESTWIQFCYHLKNGTEVNRNYLLPIYKENLKDGNSLETVITDLLNTKDTQKQMYFADKDRFTLEYAYVDVYRNELSYNYSLTPGELDGLQDALLKDVEAGNVSSAGIFYSDEEVYDLYNINLECVDKDHLSREMYYVSNPYTWMSVNSQMIYTIEYIRNVIPFNDANSN